MFVLDFVFIYVVEVAKHDIHVVLVCHPGNS